MNRRSLLKAAPAALIPASGVSVPAPVAIAESIAIPDALAALYARRKQEGQEDRGMWVFLDASTEVQGWLDFSSGLVTHCAVWNGESYDITGMTRSALNVGQDPDESGTAV